jgi:type I restriction enzyme S subunit
LGNVVSSRHSASQARTSLADIVTSAESGFACGEDVSHGLLQLRMNNVTVDGTLDWSDRRRVPADAGDLGRYGLEPGDIMFNCTNSSDLVGKTALFAGFGEPVVYSNHFLRVRLNRKRAEPVYVSWWLFRQWRRREFERLAICWVNQATVRKDDLLDMQIALPDLPVQRRIAGILAQADRLRRMRRYALELSDQFLPALFLRMFGDIETNPQGLPRAQLCELAEIQIGNTPPREDADNYGDDVEWIKSDNIVQGALHPTKASEMLSAKGVPLGTLVDPGAILVTCIAGSLASIGNVAATDRRVAFNQQLCSLSPHKDVDPLFLYGMMLKAKPLVQRQATEAMKRMVSKGRLEEVSLFRPSVSRQREFAKALMLHETSRAVTREALRQAEHLFQSLLNQYFGKES